jgi:hypothetical protein
VPRSGAVNADGDIGSIEDEIEPPCFFCLEATTKPLLRLE